MTCQGCGKKPATTFLKKTINGKTTELHLCADCAAKQGIGGMLGGFDLGDFWGSLFAEPSLRQQTYLQRNRPVRPCGLSGMLLHLL